MLPEKIKQQAEHIHKALQEPDFPLEMMSLVIQEQGQQPKDAIERLILEELDDLSTRIDLSGIQESCSVRNIWLTRELAFLFVNEHGELLLDLVNQAIDRLARHLHQFGVGRLHDSNRRHRILKVLTLLKNNKEARR